MAGVVGRVQLRQNLKAFTAQALVNVRNDAVETGKVAGLLAQAAGQDTIWHTPSSLSHEPKDDRVWTGRMVDHFEHDVTPVGNKVIVRYGWISDKAKYFLIQEYGGQVDGKTVTPMFAIANATSVARDYLKSKGIQA